VRCKEHTTDGNEIQNTRMELFVDEIYYLFYLLTKK